MRRDTILDTQLVSYAMKGTHTLPADGCAITSVTAQELLLMQGGELTRNNYYIPFFTDVALAMDTSQIRQHLKSLPARIRTRAGQRATDKFVLDFGRDYPAVIEYSHLATARLLNVGHGHLIKGYASVLERKSHRVVVDRLDFLIDQGVQCRALTDAVAVTALEMFAAFTAKYALKKKFRNSLNDLLSLAVAVEAGALFKTEDRLLAEFAAEHAPSSIQEIGGVLAIDFAPEGSGRRLNRGTKGYVNRGWGVRRQAWRPDS
ncbi:hypothetical protein [Micromonospora coerulea]